MSVWEGGSCACPRLSSAATSAAITPRMATVASKLSGRSMHGELPPGSARGGKAGDIVRVKVLEVDLARKRTALTLRLDDEVGPRADHTGAAAPRNNGSRPPPACPIAQRGPMGCEEEGNGALADALRGAGLSEKRK
jgi:hypothetical protein